MAFYALAMGAIASILNRSGQRPATDLVLKFLEHFAAIRQAMEHLGVWDETDGLYYDQLITPDGTEVPVKVRSMVGIIPLLAAVVVDEEVIARAETVGKQFARLLDARGLGDMEQLAERGLLRGEPGDRRLLLGVVGVDRLLRLFDKLFDEDEFLSPYGLRALSAYHREHPYELDVEGITATIDYEPAESTTAMFGGNSNWRGPLWFPLNYLVVSALERYHRFFGDDFEIEYPTGSGTMLTLDKIADDLRERLVSLFLVGADGRRPWFGEVERLQQDPAWKDNLVFNEYFHGDNGAGLGATHQTGWTGVVADLIRGRPATASTPSASSPGDNLTPTSPRRTATTSSTKGHRDDHVAVRSGDLRAQHRGLAPRRRPADRRHRDAGRRPGGRVGPRDAAGRRRRVADGGVGTRAGRCGAGDGIGRAGRVVPRRPARLRRCRRDRLGLLHQSLRGRRTPRRSRRSRRRPRRARRSGACGCSSTSCPTTSPPTTDGSPSIPTTSCRATPTTSRDDPAAFIAVGDAVIARGRDPYFPPWPDVAQLNAFAPGLRQAAADDPRSTSPSRPTACAATWRC